MAAQQRPFFPEPSVPLPVPDSKPPIEEVKKPRLELVAIKRRINGVLLVELLDRSSKSTQELFAYDAYENLVLTKIDLAGGTATFVDEQLKTVTLTLSPDKKATSNGQ